jgi:hypothetical protein
MQRLSLDSALLVLGMTGPACAESPNPATSGPHNPVDTRPKSGRLAGVAPTVPNPGGESMRYAGRACPDNQRAPVQPTTVPHR